MVSAMDVHLLVRFHVPQGYSANALTAFAAIDPSIAIHPASLLFTLHRGFTFKRELQSMMSIHTPIILNTHDAVKIPVFRHMFSHNQFSVGTVHEHNTIKFTCFASQEIDGQISRICLVVTPRRVPRDIDR